MYKQDSKKVYNKDWTRGFIHVFVTCSKFSTKPRLSDLFFKPLLPSCCFHVGILFTIAAFGNRPFPSSLVPLFQSESKCETIVMKLTLICMKMKLHAELIFI